MADAPSSSRSRLGRSSDWLRLGSGLGAIAALTALYTQVLAVDNPTTAALSFLLIVLLVAAVSNRPVAVLTSLGATLAFNFFFLPPLGTLSIADPANWAALFTFLAVAIVASQLGTNARRREHEARERRAELGRLFDLSRDILIATDGRDAVGMLARHIVRRFGFDYAAVCLPGPDGWQVHDSGAELTLDPTSLERAFAATRGALEFDAHERTYGGHAEGVTREGTPIRLVPLRLGTRAIGLLAATGSHLEQGTLDAIAGIGAIAIERANLLDERRTAALLQQSAELKSALLSSLSHDLRTPLTAITVAAGNLQAGWLDEAQRREQAIIVQTEVERLNRLFQNLVDMARIETHAVDTETEWATPADIVAAAVAQAGRLLDAHPVEVDASSTDLVRVDPRLLSTALAHLLENAAQYSPDGAPIAVAAHATETGLRLVVRDRGPGIAAEDLEHLFERFYRGSASGAHPFGTGMGLAITRGLLAAAGGKVWAENAPDGGARFTIDSPGEVRRDFESAAAPAAI